MSVTIQFLGAAQTVTGSKHLVTVDGRRFLIDCGLFQGTPELKERNWQPLPIRPDEIDTVILTHAHLDHIGYLPKLYLDGYRKPILCTGATSEITRLSLPDSGHLQEEHARYVNKRELSKHKPALPLYTAKDAEATCKMLEPMKLDVVHDLGNGINIRFRRAGHILGSSFIEFFLPDGRKIVFSGDLGRPNTPIIRDPEIIEAADYLLVESTYGDRQHPATNPADFLADAISQIHQTGGVLVIPAFAIGRTQDLLFYLNELENSNRVPKTPVFVDSPMAVDATGIYARHHEDHDIEVERLESDNDNPLKPGMVTFVKKQDDSKKLNALRGPAIIISSSGMATGGRVMHHLAQRLPDPANIVMFVGYQAEGTLGRRLREGSQEVAIFGKVVQVRAQVLSLGSLSAHADATEIMAWLRGFKVPPKRTFIVHGEVNAQRVLQAKIKEELGWDAYVPSHLEVAEL